ncbi:DNA cytosine methyltransferase [Spiroplasma chrysopicola]|uniref:Cytosine-specific methyltransferase n=1 Tax=Spiroplasma chrysopicola DF-1 TaxID=1276227 RepID=R4UEW7_9MOLU|nr:DNA (cytosine-5-)-methyltransferase [Spiroplasma chrysopicola]AGM24640.1 DNA (cytosine-5-)-methyltransferase [Spiroplasma chrysopicola DF-1]
MSNKYTVLELFAGAGGLALGLEKAGFNTLGLIEVDKWAVETLKNNRPEWNIIHDDIINIVNQGIKNFVNTNVDVVSGGFPCQSFSYAGKRLGLEDTRGTMFYYYAEIVKELQPKIFLVENVKGLVNHDFGKTFKTILNVFEDLNYKLYWKVLNAWDYNVAQKRERLVLIGIRKDFSNKEFLFPNPIAPKLVLKDVLKKVPNSVGAEYPKRKKEILSLVPPGGCWRDLPDDLAQEYMGKSYFLGGGRTGMARRISWNEPSLTLTCSPAQKQTERCHPDETRPFTTREYARIQSFPDNWIFAGSINNIYKQIGNAVPVELAKNIGISIINYINNVNKEKK